MIFILLAADVQKVQHVRSESEALKEPLIL